MFEEVAQSELGLTVGCMFAGVEQYFARSVELLNSGDLARALSAAERAIRMAPQSPIGFRCRAFVRSALDDHARALHDFDKALALGPDHVPTLDNRGISLARLGRLAEAFDAFSQAIGLSPRYARAYAHRALVARDLGLEEQASADERIAAELPDGSTRPDRNGSAR